MLAMNMYTLKFKIQYHLQAYKMKCLILNFTDFIKDLYITKYIKLM